MQSDSELLMLWCLEMHRYVRLKCLDLLIGILRLKLVPRLGWCSSRRLACVLIVLSWVMLMFSVIGLKLCR